MIRYFKPEDKEFYTALSIDFYNSPACDHKIPTSHFELTFDECLKMGAYARGVILESNGIKAGFGLFSITFSCEAGGIVIWLEELYILPEYRSHGLGKEFFEFVYKEYPEAKRFRLEVTDVNERAIKLYKKLGYKQVNYLQMSKDIT